MLKMELPGQRRGARPLRRFMNVVHEEAGGLAEEGSEDRMG